MDRVGRVVSMAEVISSVGGDTWGGLSDGYRRGQVGVPTSSVGQPPRQRGTPATPGGAVKAPKIFASAARNNQGTNVAIPYARVAPAEEVSRQGRVEAGDVLFLHRQMITSTPVTKKNNVQVLTNASLPSAAVVKMAGVDGVNQMLRTYVAGSTVLVNSANPLDDWRALTAMQEWVLDGVCMSSEEGYFLSPTADQRNDRVFNVAVAGPTRVNNGYRDSSGRGLAARMARQHSLAAGRLTSAGDDAPLPLPGPIYNEFPHQMFDRHVRVMSELYVGLVATKIKAPTVEDTTAEAARAMWQNVWNSGGPVEGLDAWRGAGGEPFDHRTGHVHVFEYVLFSDRQAWQHAQVQVPVDGAPEAMPDPDIVDSANLAAKTRRAMGAAKMGDARQRALGAEPEPEGQRRGPLRDRGPGKRKRDGDGGEEHDFLGITQRELTHMVGAWRVGRVLDTRAQLRERYSGGPDDTTFALTVNVDVDFLDWRALRRRLWLPWIGNAVRGNNLEGGDWTGGGVSRATAGPNGMIHGNDVGGDATHFGCDLGVVLRWPTAYTAYGTKRRRDGEGKYSIPNNDANVPIPTAMRDARPKKAPGVDADYPRGRSGPQWEFVPGSTSGKGVTEKELRAFVGRLVFENGNYQTRYEKPADADSDACVGSSAVPEGSPEGASEWTGSLPPLPDTLEARVAMFKKEMGAIDARADAISERVRAAAEAAQTAEEKVPEGARNRVESFATVRDSLVQELTGGDEAKAAEAIEARLKGGLEALEELEELARLREAGTSGEEDDAEVRRTVTANAMNETDEMYADLQQYLAFAKKQLAAGLKAEQAYLKLADVATAATRAAATRAAAAAAARPATPAARAVYGGLRPPIVDVALNLRNVNDVQSRLRAIPSQMGKANEAANEAYRTLDDFIADYIAPNDDGTPNKNGNAAIDEYYDKVLPRINTLVSRLQQATEEAGGLVTEAVVPLQSALEAILQKLPPLAPPDNMSPAERTQVTERFTLHRGRTADYEKVANERRDEFFGIEQEFGTILEELKSRVVRTAFLIPGTTAAVGGTAAAGVARDVQMGSVFDAAAEKPAAAVGTASRAAGALAKKAAALSASVAALAAGSSSSSASGAVLPPAAGGGGGAPASASASASASVGAGAALEQDVGATADAAQPLPPKKKKKKEKETIPRRARE